MPINPLKAIQQQLSNNEDTNGLDKDSVRQLLTQMNISEVLAGSSGVGQGNKKDMGQHKFWSTQPVALPQEGSQDGPIDPTVDVEKFSKVPLSLPKEYEWVDVDLDNAQEVSEVCSVFTPSDTRRSSKMSENFFVSTTSKTMTLHCDSTTLPNSSHGHSSHRDIKRAGMSVCVSLPVSANL